MNNNSYNNLAEATEKLMNRGFRANFRVNDNKLLEDGQKHTYKPSQVELVEFHRFEGISNPADSSILYAVKTNSGLKGIVVDSYGADGSEITSEFMNQTKNS